MRSPAGAHHRAPRRDRAMSGRRGALRPNRSRTPRETSIGSDVVPHRAGDGRTTDGHSKVHACAGNRCFRMWASGRMPGRLPITRRRIVVSSTPNGTDRASAPRSGRRTVRGAAPGRAVHESDVRERYPSPRARVELHDVPVTGQGVRTEDPYPVRDGCRGSRLRGSPAPGTARFAAHRRSRRRDESGRSISDSGHEDANLRKAESPSDCDRTTSNGLSDAAVRAPRAAGHDRSTTRAPLRQRARTCGSVSGSSSGTRNRQGMRLKPLAPEADGRCRTRYHGRDRRMFAREHPWAPVGSRERMPA